MKNLILILGLLGLVGCATAPTPKTKWTDKNMRVMIDPDSIDESHYVQIQTALVRTGKFTVVDRGAAMRAAKKEQERLHQTEGDRFEDREKWAHWGKMFGVGSIIVAHVQCVKEGHWFDPKRSKLFCKQNLSMVDANTGEVLLAVSGENDGPSSADTNYMVPDWKEVTTQMVEEYPKFFVAQDYAGPAAQYQKVSEEHGKRQKEKRAIAAQKVEVKSETDEQE
jgi:hypothetical protein